MWQPHILTMLKASYLSNGNWRTWGLSSHGRVLSHWLSACSSLSHRGAKGDFWERGGLLLTVVPSEGTHTTRIHIHASYADIRDAEECPHLSFKAMLHPGFRPLALSRSFSCVMRELLCFDPHQFLFLKCPSTRPEILSILKDGQSPASFRKLFLIYPTGIDPSLLSILIFISVPSFPSLISQAPVFSPHCPACRSCSVNIWWSIPWAYLRCVLPALHLSETTRLLLSKLVMLHSLEHWQTF